MPAHHGLLLKRVRVWFVFGTERAAPKVRGVAVELDEIKYCQPLNPAVIPSINIVPHTTLIWLDPNSSCLCFCQGNVK